MSDRELLELAAKAAGYGYGEWTKAGIVFADKDAVWNPLTSYEDALRLALRLGISIVPGATGYYVEIDDISCYAITTGDDTLPVLFAIVEVAAQVGRWMN